VAYFLGHPVYRTQKTSSKQCTRKPKAAIKQQKLLYSIYWGVFIHGIFAANFARNFCGSSRCGQFKFVYQQMLNAIAIADMYFCETSWFCDWCDMAKRVHAFIRMESCCKYTFVCFSIHV